jgi:TRAP-type C4-dicarboxylate transport system substrate-binding protein
MKPTAGLQKLSFVLLLIFFSTVTRAEETLTLVSSWNSRQNFTAHFLQYIDAVNIAGEGVVQIKFLGGPEVIPQRQLLYALRRGVIDMAFGGMTYYRGLLPEGDAMFASTITPLQARANGGLDTLQPYWEQRINAHLIGWMQSGIGPHFYLTDEPSFGPDGLLDLTGLKIRTSPTNVELVNSTGARAVQIAVKEIYTAFQRGAVDGLAWPTIGFPDLGISDYVHYRVDPDVLQLSITLQINLDRWDALSPAARRILTEQAIIYEQKSRTDLFAIRDRELAELEAAGFKSIAMKPEVAARWTRHAHQVVWDRFEARSPESAAELKPLFFPEGVQAD